MLEVDFLTQGQGQVSTARTGTRPCKEKDDGCKEDDSGGRAIEDEGDSERAILRIGVT